MSQSQEYGFCPNCGAVSKNGVCTSCGYKSHKSLLNNSPAGQSGYAGLVVASVSAVILFAAVILTYHFLKFDKTPAKQVDSPRGSYSSTSIVKPSISMPDIYTYDDDETEEYFSQKVFNNFDTFIYPEYTEDAEATDYDYYDEYDYYVYDDYIMTDFDYKIVNKLWHYSGDEAADYGTDYPDTAYITCHFPTIESDSLKCVSEINDIIIDTTTYMCDYYDVCKEYLEDDEFFYGKEYVYVTYMSEDVLSLAFEYECYFYKEDDEEAEPDFVFYTLKTANFDLNDGSVIKMPKLSMDEDTFLDRFIKDVDEQNEVDLLGMAERDEIAEALEKGDMQWFYNPLGVEFVYVFPGGYGYLSCTEDPDEVFAK